MNVTEPLLDVRDLRVTFPYGDGTVEALRGITFSVMPGEAVGILGESGSGKSLTALAIMRLIAPPGKISNGTVTLEGRDLLTLSEREMRSIRGREVSIVFQDSLTSLNPAFTIATQLTDVIRAHHGVDAREGMRRAADALELVGIEKQRLHSYPHEFSGGMRQRALLAMAIACKPKLLIADEPTTALDVTIQSQIISLLAQLQRELGLSLIFITHNLDLLAELCDRAIVLYGGSVMETASVEDLFNSAEHPYTRRLLECIPRLDNLEQLPKPIPGQPPTLGELQDGCPFAPRCTEVRAECPTVFPPSVIHESHSVCCWAVR